MTATSWLQAVDMHTINIISFQVFQRWQQRLGKKDILIKNKILFLNNWKKKKKSWNFGINVHYWLFMKFVL